jgi:hypothetical protein
MVQAHRLEEKNSITDVTKRYEFLGALITTIPKVFGTVREMEEEQTQ